jgi:hypothetical protein
MIDKTELFRLGAIASCASRINGRFLSLQIRLAAEFSPQRSGFEPRPGYVGFVVDKVALGLVFAKYFGFPCQFSFYRLLHIHHHLSSGAGTIGQLMADIPSGLSLTPPHKTKNEAVYKGNCYCIKFKVSM